MKIKVSEIPEEGLEVELVCRPEGLGVKASAQLSLRRVGVDVLVNGQVKSQVPLECGRCLGTFTLDISAPVELSLSVDGELEDEVELSEEDLLRGFMNEEIDLGQFVEEQVLLNVPMRPLCSADCRGLCPECGADLNVGDCECSHDNGDPRFQILRKLLNKGENE